MWAELPQVFVFRLYDELDFKCATPFTDPEILRSSLAAGVILRKKSLRLTDVERLLIEPIEPQLP